MEISTPLLEGRERPANGEYGSTSSGGSLSVEHLSEMIRQGQVSTLKSFGGAGSLAKKLNSDRVTGFHRDFPIAKRREEFGANYVAPPPEPSYCQLLADGLQDTTIIMLICSSVVSLVLGLGVERDFEHGWIEGLSILVSVLVVINVQAGTDYSKAKEFRRQQLELENQSKVEVIRGGESQSLSPRELVVGDIIRFGVGDILAVDGVLLEGSDVKIDESALTGETNLISKNTSDKCFLLSGTNVMNGTGKLLVLAVGINSVQGSILHTVGSSEEVVEVPGAGTLVEKLDSFALLIGKFGSAVAAITVVIMVVRWSIQEFALNGACQDKNRAACDVLSRCSFDAKSSTCKRAWDTGSDLSELLSFFVTGITILVVAIPEGLPLAVTLSLAVSIRRMTKDNNQVKHLDSCETMGSATTICSDKTGTLTLNRMNVVRCFLGEQNHVQHSNDEVGLASKLCKGSGTLSALSESFRDLLAQAVILDSSSTSKVQLLSNGTCKYTGNPTECALLKLVSECGYEAKEFREAPAFQDPNSELADWGTFVFPFSSARKRMSYVVPAVMGKERKLGGYHVYSKGAPDYIIQSSSSFLHKDGKTTTQLSAATRERLYEAVKGYQNAGLRVIGVGYRHLEKKPSAGWDSIDKSPVSSESANVNARDVENDLTLLGLFGIEDPLRPEVIEAIKKCNRAGVDVRMCTGDALDTAVSIARQAGILSDRNMDGSKPKTNFAMTGPEFRYHIDRLDTSQPKRLRKIFDPAKGVPVEKLEYPVLRGDDGEVQVDQEKLDEIWPKLRVLARCQPEDKLALVKGMKDSEVFEDAEYCAELRSEYGIEIFPDHQVVAVTGDGTNDAPALKKADVGFAMGIVGTETAKQACDILLMDDNFASIVQAIKWGRNVYDSISKFIQFQLTVNVVAIVVAVIGATVYNQSPLSAVQMLWINLIMDSLASLALATEPPNESQLERQPYGKRRPILSRIMLYNILGQSVYQLAVVLLLLFVPSIIPGNVTPNSDADTSTYGSVHWTVVFNAFVQLQLFNELNSRKLQTVQQLKDSWQEWNVLSGLFQNSTFVAVVLSTVVLQVMIVQYGGAAFKLCQGGLTFAQWVFCLVIGAISLVWQWAINLAIVVFETGEEKLIPVRVVSKRARSRAARLRWSVLRKNVQYGSRYARLLRTNIKGGLVVSRVTNALRGQNRRNYHYPFSKQDSVETEKMIRELAKRTLSQKTVDTANEEEDEE